VACHAFTKAAPFTLKSGPAASRWLAPERGERLEWILARACNFERIPLPHLTWEKRRCHAFRIGTGNGRKRPAVCFLAGVHGREWGGPDILVYLGMILLRAYRDGVGQKVFTRAQVRAIMETIDVVVFPQVNPDGR
jgi:murein tripeptide amidase MpaA